MGDQLIGIYPLLPNNTSNFIAADFDDDNWLVEAQKFIQACEDIGLPAYLERSRSGNVDMCGCSSQNRIPRSRAARYFYLCFKPQECRIVAFDKLYQKSSALAIQLDFFYQLSLAVLSSP